MDNQQGKNKVDKTNIKTCVTAAEAWHEAEAGRHGYGYFSDDFCSISRAVTEGRINSRCYYGHLDGILDESKPKRFVFEDKMFALFYPTDDELNVSRY